MLAAPCRLATLRRELNHLTCSILACTGTRRFFRKPKSARYPAVEEVVPDWVQDQISKSLSVCYADIEAKARTVAQDMCIPRTEFKVSKKWVTNFIKRNGLSLRRHTTRSSWTHLKAKKCDAKVKFKKKIIRSLSVGRHFGGLKLAVMCFRFKPIVLAILLCFPSKYALLTTLNKLTIVILPSILWKLEFIEDDVTQ